MDSRTGTVMLDAMVKNLGEQWIRQQLESLSAQPRATLPRERITFEARCQDCGWHWTGSGRSFIAEDARSRALAHAEHNAMHRVQVCDWNGWHRP